ncbi:MAG: winged helix-turn-helix domain-containing protein [Aggregatilineales bacterium]
MLTKFTIPASEFLDRVLSRASEGLFLIDCDGIVVYCNSLVEKLTGAKPEHLFGKSYTLLFDRIINLSCDPQQIKRELALALKNFEQAPEINLSTNNPMTGRLQIRFFPIPNEEQSEPSCVWGGIIRDVSREWTEVTQQAQYLSHVLRELRLSLAEVSGLAASLLSSHSNWDVDERRHFLQNLSGGVDQLSHFMENAQDLFKLEMGETKMDPHPTAAKPLIQQAIRSLGFKVTGYHFSVTVPDDLPLIAIDANIGERIFRNILISAIKRTPLDSTLQVCGTSTHEEVVLSFADSGLAISEEHLQHIFEPFYHVGTDHKNSGVGNGLELYAAQRFTLALGGRIWAERMGQVGTTLHCAFPLRPQLPEVIKLPPPPLRPNAKPKTQTQARSRQHSIRVLVVEDDLRTAELFRIVLASGEYQVVIARNGRQALEMAYDKPPEIILLDLHLPDMDGFALYAQLREVLSVPIIVLTGNLQRETKIQALDLGIDDYLVKPIDSAELLARIRTILRRTAGSVIGHSNPSIHIGKLYIDVDQRQVTIEDKPVKLTPTEFKLLHVLARNAGRILSHSQLLSAVWGPQYGEEKEYLWVHINRLRRKLDDDPAHPRYILTEPNVGYHLPSPTDVAGPSA